jgi:hypothetical protein
VARLEPSIRGEGPGARLSPAQRARLHVASELRRSGLVYGTPKLLRRVSMGQRIERSDALFLATISAECLLALDVARIFGVPFHRARAETELTMLLAAAIGAIELAEELRAKVIGADPRALDGLQLRVEEALLARTPQVTGDPAFDLPLHDAIAGARRACQAHAIDSTARAIPRRVARRASRASGRCCSRRSALAAPPRADRARPCGPPAAACHAGAGAEVRAAIDPRRRRSSSRRRSARGCCGASCSSRSSARWRTASSTRREARSSRPPRRGRREADRVVADFFADPEDVLDAFEVLRRASASEAVVDRIARELVENLDRVGNEVKETGELGLLLAKAARGHKLTPSERAKAREQLLDLAKVVPSLAIIAAPGGMLIFAALLKVLPFSILPSSFHPKEKARPGERAIAALRRRRDGD